MKSNNVSAVKGLVTELTPLHAQICAQSDWGFRGKRVQTAVIAAYCNYL